MTDGGLNAIVRVDSTTHEIRSYPLPAGREGANLNTATFDRKGVLWFTGQAGIYGRLDPRTGSMRVYDAPRGRGPYGIATTPGGEVYYASLAGNYVGRIDTATGEATVLEPPHRARGPVASGRTARDASGSASGTLANWLPSIRPAVSGANGDCPVQTHRAYAVFVDEQDQVWVSDFGANTLCGSTQ